MNELLIAGQTDVGQRRTDNQDTFLCQPIWSESSALLVVIDGVGGYAGGDRAAHTARESIERYMTAPNGDPLTMLREAVVFANNQINEQRQQDPKLAQMCCVLTAAVADARQGKLYFVHVGDTRLYRYRHDALEKLTADHSLVGIREDANQLTEAEAMKHPRRNEILREVGSTEHRVDDPDFLDSGETDFQPGDVLLLCSDGLTDMITQAQIMGVLNRPLALEAQVDGLIKLANKQGGNDNITVVLAKNEALLTGNPPIETPGQSARQRLPEQPVATVPPLTPVNLSTPRRTPISLWVVAGLLLMCLLAVVWHEVKKKGMPLTTDTVHTIAVKPDPGTTALVRPSRLDSLVQLAQRSADHRLVLTDDTLRLSQPLQLTDSLLTIIGGTHPTVLIPADTAQATLAVRIRYRGAVSLENLVISGFKTGVETTGPARLLLKNVYFRGVGLPVDATVRQDTFQNVALTIGVQNLLPPPKPTHP